MTKENCITEYKLEEKVTIDPEILAFSKHNNNPNEFGEDAAYYGQGGRRRTRRKTSQKRRKSSQRKTRRGK